MSKPVMRVKAGSRPHVMGYASRTAYQGADLNSQATAGWMPALQSADAEWLGERNISIARIRDLTRNESWAQSAVDRLVDMSVGAQFRLSAKPDARALGITEAEALEYGKRIEAKWRAFAEDPTFRCDIERGLPFVGLVGLAAREFFQVGEAIGVLRWKPRDNWPYATCMQMVDADRLSNPAGQPDSVGMRGGVEFDEDGAPIAYHIRQAHPGDAFTNAESFVWKRIERFDLVQGWERPKVLHLYEKRRPGQTRGVSRLMAALVKTRLLSRYSESEVKAAAINGAIVGTIYSQMGPEFAGEALGLSNIKGKDESVMETLSGQRAEWYDAPRFRADDARFLTLYPTDKMEMNTQQRQVSGFPAFQTSFLQSFAASLGMSYEQLSMDWSRVNYSSARAALTEVWRSIHRLRSIITWGYVQPFYTAWLEDALDTGDIEMPKGAPDFYSAPAAHVRAKWIGPGRGYVDPVKEAQASILRRQGNISTLEKEVNEQGEDYEMILEQLARENKELERLGLLPPDGVIPSKSHGKPLDDEDQDEADRRERSWQE